jgi:polysaccharide export outer membrane protein
MLKRIIGISFIALLFASCNPLNPSIMFKTPKDYKYDIKSDTSELEYKIAPNDVITFRLFTNNGFKLIDVSNENNNQFQNLNNGLNYLVEFDGHVNLPIIGRVPVSGLTLREAEFFLEEKYADIYIDPFILLDLSNRRVTVFPGNGGNGRVITLTNNNVTLLEALAQAGGIRESGRAAKVKLIRGDLRDPEVYLIDLSTIEGISDASIILQANDIIYVEPVGVTRRQFISEISPILSLISSIITLYLVVNSLE